MNPFPLLQKLESCEKILIAGAGGGFDVFCGLPLYFHLAAKGKMVQLANLSFSSISAMSGDRLTPSMLEVNAETGYPDGYFPEKYLCQFLTRHFGRPISIQCIEQTGAKNVAAAYQAMQVHYDFDCVLLVDGGTDSLMRGDEAGLGTPQEDVASLFGVNQLKLEHKYLACLGFGVDTFHGVNHFQFLEAVAAINESGGYLGSFSLLKEMEEVQLYDQACQAAYAQMPHRPSIVNLSIQTSIEGKYGDVHSTTRTNGSKLWINPLMQMYWAFQVNTVAERCLYMDRIAETESMADLTMAIVNYREQLKSKREWDTIPA